MHVPSQLEGFTWLELPNLALTRTTETEIVLIGSFKPWGVKLGRATDDRLSDPSPGLQTCYPDYLRTSISIVYSYRSALAAQGIYHHLNTLFP